MSSSSNSTEFVVPEPLLQRPIPQRNENPLHIFGRRYGVRGFREVTPELLRHLYKEQDAQSRRLFWRVINQLAFFGFIFKSPRLKSSNILHVSHDSLYLWPPHSIRAEPIQWNGMTSARTMALEHGLVLREDALGVPVESLSLLVPEVPVERVLHNEGFELLAVQEITERALAERNHPLIDKQSDSDPCSNAPLENESKRVPMEVEQPLRLKVAGEELVLPSTARTLQITTEDLPNCPSLATKLEQRGYSTWGSLPYELDDLLLSIKGVGRTHIRKFSTALLSNGASLSEKEASQTKPTKGRLVQSQHWRGVPLEYLQEFPVSIDIFFDYQTIVESLRGAGVETLAGFYQIPDLKMFLTTFDELDPSEVDDFLLDLDSWIETIRKCGAAKVLWLRGNHVIVPDHICVMPLRVLAECQVKTLSSLAERLLSIGFETLEDLPASLGQATTMNSSVTNDELRFLFDLIVLYKNHVGKQRLGQYFLDPLVEYAANLAHGEKPQDVDDRGWYLFQRKLDSLQAGERFTLQQMGAIMSVTRERARQIQRRTLDILSEPYGGLIADLRLLLQEEGHQYTPLAFCVSEPVNDSRTELSLGLLLEVRKVHLDYKFKLLSTNRNASQRQELINRLQKRVQRDFEGCVFSEEELTKVIKDFIQTESLSIGVEPYLVSHLKETYLTCLPGKRLGLHVTKQHLALQVFRDYSYEHPEGVALYRDAGLLRTRLDQIIPGIFSNDHNFITCTLQSEKVILWGRGRYLHRDQIQASPSDIRPIAEWVEQQFQQGIPHLSSRAPFLKFQAELQEVGIPNDYALYSLLRLYFSERFFLAEYPKIFPLGQLRNLSNFEIMEAHLRKHGSQTYAALEKEFVEKRGWYPYQLHQTVLGSDAIISTGKGAFGLLRSYPAAERLVPLADYLTTQLRGDLQSISVRLLFRERKATCLQLGIDNERLLYSLISNHFEDQFAFPQFPHIARRVQTTATETSFRRFVEKFLIEAEGPILGEELQYEFVGRRGWTDQQLYNALMYQDNILPLQRGDVSELVHEQVLGWDENKQERFEASVEQVVKDVSQRAFPFGNVRRDLLDQSRLPKLDGRIRWTEDLLKAKLEEMDNILLLGTRGSLFAAYPNAAGVEDNVDFVAHILATEFQGAAKVQALQRRLAELNFRTAPLKRPPNGDTELPYYFIGDEILLKRGH